jgi:hypothetical protein
MTILVFAVKIARRRTRADLELRLRRSPQSSHPNESLDCIQVPPSLECKHADTEGAEEVWRCVEHGEAVDDNGVELHPDYKCQLRTHLQRHACHWQQQSKQQRTCCGRGCFGNDSVKACGLAAGWERGGDKGAGISGFAPLC